MKKLFYTTAPLTITILLMSLPGQAQDITGCLSWNKGEVYNVQVGATPSAPCKRRDSILSWDQVGPQGDDGMDGMGGAQGPPGPQLVEVVDQFGTAVGDIVGVNDNHLRIQTPIAAFQVGSTVFTLRLLAVWPFYVGTFLGISEPSLGPEIHFTTSDCTGIPLMRLSPVINTLAASSVFPVVTVRPEVGTDLCDGVCTNLTVYRADPDANPFPLSDFEGSRFEDGGFDCVSGPFSGNFVDALTLVDLGQHFTPPLTVNFLGTPLE